MEQAFERGLAEMQSAGDYRERLVDLDELLCAAVFGRPGLTRGSNVAAICSRSVTGYRASKMTAGAAIGSLEAMRGNVAEARELLAGSRTIAEDRPPPVAGGTRKLRRPDGAARGRSGRGRAGASAWSRGARGPGRDERALDDRRVPGQDARSGGPAGGGRAVRRDQRRLGVRDDVYPQVVWRVLSPGCRPGEGSSPSPKQLAGEAVARAAETDFLNLRGESLLDLAEVLRIAGRRPESPPPRRRRRSACSRRKAAPCSPPGPVGSLTSHPTPRYGHSPEERSVDVANLNPRLRRQTRRGRCVPGPCRTGPARCVGGVLASPKSPASSPTPSCCPPRRELVRARSRQEASRSRNLRPPVPEPTRADARSTPSSSTRRRPWRRSGARGHLLLRCEEEPGADVAALLRGQARLAPARPDVAVSVLTGQEVALGAAELDLLLAVPTDRWVRDEDAGDPASPPPLRRAGAAGQRRA